MRKRLRVIIVISVTFVILFLYLYTQNTWIEQELFEIAHAGIPSAFDGFTIVHLSDTHLRDGESNYSSLVGLIRGQAPDIIVASGDLMDASAQPMSCGLSELYGELVTIAPVYAVTGNHEMRGGIASQWREVLTQCGVTVIEGNSVAIERESSEIILMGLSDGKRFSRDAVNGVEGVNDSFAILVAHRPELFDQYVSDAQYAPDLVFSGHTHGGQLRVPFIGGLFAPNQGFFPKYDAGLYRNEHGAMMVLSRGIGNSRFPFRVHNRPHLPVIVLRSVTAPQ